MRLRIQDVADQEMGKAIDDDSLHDDDQPDASEAQLLAEMHSASREMLLDFLLVVRLQLNVILLVLLVLGVRDHAWLRQETDAGAHDQDQRSRKRHQRGSQIPRGTSVFNNTTVWFGNTPIVLRQDTAARTLDP